MTWVAEQGFGMAEEYSREMGVGYVLGWLLSEESGSWSFRRCDHVRFRREFEGNYVSLGANLDR